MTIYSFPRIVALVREKNVKLHLSTSKIVVTQAGRMMLVSPIFGQGMYGTFKEPSGVFTPNKVFLGEKGNRGERGLAREEAKLMLTELTLIEEKGIDGVKEISRLTGNCCVCGRILTNEESIEEGIGPICSGKLANF